MVSSLDLNWLIRLLGLAENTATISDYSSTRPLLLLLIFLAIVIGFVLLQLVENDAPNGNANEVDQSEQEHPSGELGHYFEGVQEQPGDGTTASHGGVVRRHGACSFCGNLSTTRCSRCKAARYCSVVCQIQHWRSGHKYECFERETAANQGRPVHFHGASMVVYKSERESTSIASQHGVEWNSDVSSGSNASSFHGCEVCGSPSTTRCSRCKAVRYCSAKCLIVDWRWHKVHCTAKDVNSDITDTERTPHGDVHVGMPNNTYEKEENVHSSGPLSLEFYPEGTTNFMSPIKGSKETNKEAQERSAEWVGYLEEEVAKSRNEIILLQSERDKWRKRANFAKERYHSFKKEYEHQLFVLKNEKEMISNAEKEAGNVIHSLSERLQHFQIAMQESITEKRKQEEHIQMVETEWVQVKEELQEEQKRVQCLTVERDMTQETAQIAISEVREIGQELQEERERVKRLKENFLRDVRAAESRAASAEAKFRDLDRKVRLTNQKVAVWTDSSGKPAMACPICLTNEKDLAFGCGHMTCRDCGSKLSKCPICREQITSHVRLFLG